MDVPERLRNIVDILTTLHESTIVDIVESSTQPNAINSVRRLLSLYGDILRQFIESDGTYIHPSADKPVITSINNLKNYIYPPDGRVSSPTLYWIEEMFQEAPFTLSADHIQRMKKSVESVDGKNPE